MKNATNKMTTQTLSLRHQGNDIFKRGMYAENGWKMQSIIFTMLHTMTIIVAHALYSAKQLSRYERSSPTWDIKIWGIIKSIHK